MKYVFGGAMGSLSEIVIEVQANLLNCAMMCRAEWLTAIFMMQTRKNLSWDGK
jgi:hypothetical protein